MNDLLSTVIEARAVVLRDQDTMARATADTVLSLLEVVIPDELLTPRPPRHGQRKFIRMENRGTLARRAGVPIEDCPYENYRIEGAYRRSWIRGWESEDVRLRGATAPMLYAFRKLTMRKPHGRASKGDA